MLTQHVQGWEVIGDFGSRGAAVLMGIVIDSRPDGPNQFVTVRRRDGQAQDWIFESEEWLAEEESRQVILKRREPTPAPKEKRWKFAPPPALSYSFRPPRPAP